MNFKTLRRTDREDGVQYHYKAENGYGASIIQTTGSYGSKQGLWELAVLDSNEQITYNTSITNDVLGYLSEEEVNQTLEKIKNL
jgi:hypothetical protein